MSLRAAPEKFEGWPASVQEILRGLPDVSAAKFESSDDIISALISLKELDEKISLVDKGDDPDATSNFSNQINAQLDLVRPDFSLLAASSPIDSKLEADELQYKYMAVYSVLMADRNKKIIPHKVLANSHRGMCSEILRLLKFIDSLFPRSSCDYFCHQAIDFSLNAR